MAKNKKSPVGNKLPNPNRHVFTKEEAARGRTSPRRQSLDKAWADKLEEAGKLSCFPKTNKDGTVSKKQKQRNIVIDEIFEILLKEAAKSNIKAIEVLLDRAYGKAKQTIEADVRTQSIVYVDDKLKDI